jgi:hypothetical protein
MATLADPQPASPAGTLPRTPIRLGTFADAIREHPALDHVTLQRLVHHAKDTGLAAHLYPRLDGRNGPPLLDLNGFADWLRERQEAAAA